MEKNMGTADRTIRIVAGVAIIAAGAYYGSWWGAIGLVLLATSIVRVCPVYLPFGISTRGKRGESS